MYISWPGLFYWLIFILIPGGFGSSGKINPYQNKNDQKYGRNDEKYFL